ncbi:MAG: hypothetical protein NTZ27_07860 [Ignavibacteriales bacterium]|nr:hypothetical protein [Ignavibacteriales bacterium]
MKNNNSPTDNLVEEFLEQARSLHANIEPIRVLRARVFKIGGANILVRAATMLTTQKYFFGINYITLEEMANLENPFIVFICGSMERCIFIPAQLFFNYLSEISHDRNGEYKINIDNEFNIVLKGRNNRLRCTEFVNSWNLLLKPESIQKSKSTAEESIHAVLQGRLIEVGNIRGYKTFCPDKSKSFNNKPLSEISSIKTCPRLEFANYDVLRNIDVIWFTEKRESLIPEYAFEVELSTGTWSGVGRLATLIDYRHVRMYVISNDTKKYQQVMHSFADYTERYSHVTTDNLGELYSAELNLKKLRFDVGL